MLNVGDFKYAFQVNLKAMQKCNFLIIVSVNLVFYEIYHCLLSECWYLVWMDKS